jgi:hypothetical protein
MPPLDLFSQALIAAHSFLEDKVDRDHFYKEVRPLDLVRFFREAANLLDLDRFYKEELRIRLLRVIIKDSRNLSLLDKGLELLPRRVFQMVGFWLRNRLLWVVRLS